MYRRKARKILETAKTTKISIATQWYLETSTPLCQHLIHQSCRTLQGNTGFEEEMEKERLYVYNTYNILSMTFNIYMVVNSQKV